MTLKIQKILPSRRNKDQFWLIFSDKQKLPLYVDDLYKFGLKSGKNIDESQFNRLKQSSLYFLLYTYSLRQIALSPKISQILLPKLKQKLVFYQIKYSLQGDFSHIPEEIIDKLKSRSLLDATAFKEYLLRRYSKHPQAYLRHLFAKYQLDFPIDSKNDDQLKIRQLLTHKKYQSTNWSDRAVKTKIMASLFRKGFAYDDIKTVIDEMTQNR